MRSGSRCRSRVAALVACAALAGITPRPAKAQTPSIPVFDSLVPTAPVASPEVRIVLLEEHLASDPGDYEARWRAASEYAQLGLGESDPDVQERLWLRAQEHAAAATDANPEGLDGHYWRAVVAAMLADISGGMTKARRGDESYRESFWVLEHDPLHAGAHYLQGRIHASVMRLNVIMRFIAKTLVGGEALGNASWDKAEYHLFLAADLQPELAMHHFELAMTYESTERPEEMRSALRDAVAASQQSPYQEEYKERARKLLRDDGER